MFRQRKPLSAPQRATQRPRSTVGPDASNQLASRLRHTLIGHANDDRFERGFTAMRLPLTREPFALRSDDKVAYGMPVAHRAGIGFVAHYNARCRPAAR